MSLCICPHQGFASFHPTSKDGLCGAHGRREKEACTCVTCIVKSNKGSMEMTNQTSRSRSYICGRWMVEMEYSFYESLSLLYLDNMSTWLYYCISLFFLLFFSWTLMCPIFLSFFWVMLLGHAIFLSSLFFLDSPCLI